jgi:hypothetical protein
VAISTQDSPGTLITIDVEEHGPSGRPPRFREALEPLLGRLHDIGSEL